MMSLRLSLAVIFTSPLGLMFSVSAQDQPAPQISIAVNTIPGLLDQSFSEAAYSKLLSRLVGMSQENVSIDYYPSTRAGKVFAENKVDCLFPGSKNVTRDSVTVIESDALNTAGAFLFANQPFDQASLLNDAKTRYRIVFRRGNTFGGTLHKLKQHVLIEVNSDIQSFGLLKNGRVNFVLAYLPDVTDLITQQDGSWLFYKAQSMFYTQNDSIICHSTAATLRFIEQLNKNIDELRQTGETKEILGKSYFEIQ